MEADLLATELQQLRPDLHDYLRRLLGTSDAADDIVQNTALRALAALDRAPAHAWTCSSAT